MTDDTHQPSDGEMNSDDNLEGTDEEQMEEEEEEEIPENHSKMLAFHAALKAVLERQVEKLQLEVNETKRLVDIGQKVKGNI